MKRQRYLLALILIFFMVIIAQITGQKEIIFPEFVALTIGAWVSNRQPWLANKRRIFFLLSISSFIGVFIVKFLKIALIAKICIAFIFTAIALTIAQSTLLPIISACILPIYLNVSTLIYPISVTVLASIIILFQWLLEKNRLKPKNVFVKNNFVLKDEFEKWTKLLIVLIAISFLPIESKHLYFIAPPLIVVFTEIANPKSKMRKKPLTLICLLSLASIVGWASRIILNCYWHLPIALCAVFACFVLFQVFQKTNTLFPPAGAILILPILLSVKDLAFYPLEVTIGSFIFIASALFLFKDKSANKNLA